MWTLLVVDTILRLINLAYSRHDQKKLGYYAILILLIDLIIIITTLLVLFPNYLNLFGPPLHLEFPNFVGLVWVGTVNAFSLLFVWLFLIALGIREVMFIVLSPVIKGLIAKRGLNGEVRRRKEVAGSLDDDKFSRF